MLYGSTIIIIYRPNGITNTCCVISLLNVWKWQAVTYSYVCYDLLHYINQNQTQYCYNYYFQTMQRYFIIENQRDLKTGLSKKKNK